MPLNSLTEIAVGLQTSKDEVYIFEPTGETADTFLFSHKGEDVEIEKAICVACIYDLFFEAFDTIRPNAFMIFPYHVSDGKASVMSEEYLAEHLPLTWSYLNAHKEILEKRSVTGKNPKWYQFGRSQSLAKFQDVKKLIWKVIATKPSYVYDEINIQFTTGGNGPYYSLINNSEYSIFYFQGILSHPLFECMVKAGASEFRGAYYSHGKQFIEHLPIRNIDPENSEEKQLYDLIVRSVQSLIETKQLLLAALGSDQDILQRKLNTVENILIRAINKLYDISEEEFEMVMNDPMFTTDLNGEE